MDTQLEAILILIRINREAQRELAKVEQTTSADFVHIDKVQESLNEQFHILLQQKEELAAALPMKHDGESRSGTVQPKTVSTPSEPQEKRGRGAEKQHYLKDESQRSLFVAHLQRIFLQYYRPGKKFRLMDGSEVKVPSFLACLYDLGIKLGITSPAAPVKDFCTMVTKAAIECAKTCANVRDFTTAYNTVQKEIKRWNGLTGQESSYYGTNAKFHRFNSECVLSDKRTDYNFLCHIYTQVEQIYNATKEA